MQSDGCHLSRLAVTALPGFNADAGLFQAEVLRRTRLPLKITRPGTWKSETFEVPYEEFETDEEEVSRDRS